MTAKIIWLVDEDIRQLRTCAALLRQALPDSLEIREVPVRPHKDDYGDILDHEDTVALILDQKLKNSGVAQYNGTELAKYVRALKSKLPVYILTNYADEAQEFAGSEWSVEDILAKDDFHDRTRTEITMARLLRHIDVYEDILSSREKRLRQLLNMGAQSELTSEEIEELSELQFQRTSVQVAEEMAKVQQLNNLIKEQDKLLKRLEELENESGS